MYIEVNFSHKNGKNIIINEVPVYQEEENTKNYDISIYLQMLMNEIDRIESPDRAYSFMDFYKRKKHDLRNEALNF